MAGKEIIDFGAKLRAAREARKISLRQIANATKISMSVLQALEDNDESRLPGGIFTRSFVRSYAGEVGLDPEKVLREFLEQSSSTRAEERITFASERPDHTLFRSYQRMANTILRLVLISVLVAVALLILNWTAGDGYSVSEPDEVEVLAESTATTALEVIPPPAVPATIEVPPVSNVAAAGPLIIDIHPRSECWVSLILDGERVFSRVMQAGEREVREAEREIIVNVGDAGAFNFAINHQKGRELGGNGEVVTARINRANYQSFITR